MANYNDGDAWYFKNPMILLLLKKAWNRGRQIWHLRGLVTRYNETKWGPQIFLGQNLFWWLQRNLVTCLFWTTGKTYNGQILQGASLTQQGSSDIYLLWLVNQLSLNFNYSRKSRIPGLISLIRLRYFIDFKKN